MAKMNVAVPRAPVRTHEGGAAHQATAWQELRRSILTCLLWEDTFYEKGSDIAQRIAGLVPKVKPEQVAQLAVEARSRMQLRHAPLFLTRELARVKGAGPLVEDTLGKIVQRADELGEFLALYWKEGKQPLAAGVKRGLAQAFQKFDAYQVAKYDRDATVKLRDVLFMVHAKPKDAEQAAVWKALVDGALAAPDTWEVALSAGKDKKETWERLLREGKLGGLACLRNLRNMQQAGVNEDLIRTRLSEGIARALPFRFLTAARIVPHLEGAIEAAMLKACEGLETFPGKTMLLVDVSGSMEDRLSAKSEVTRMDAACGLAILLREKAERVAVYTFSTGLVEVPARRGMALRDAILHSQLHGGTYLRGALEKLVGPSAGWDRLVVITDEQSHDGSMGAFVPRSYVVNVAPYQHGVSYRDRWQHIDGWSERVLDYIRDVEREG